MNFSRQKYICFLFHSSTVLSSILEKNCLGNIGVTSMGVNWERPVRKQDRPSYLTVYVHTHIREEINSVYFRNTGRDISF